MIILMNRHRDPSGPIGPMLHRTMLIHHVVVRSRSKFAVRPAEVPRCWHVFAMAPRVFPRRI